MASKKNINWGIIGLGKIAHKFAQDLMHLNGASLYAVASRDLKKAKEFGKTYNVYSCYGNYEELVVNPEVDVVYIATPHVFHQRNTLLCLQNHKAVLCEKPIAMDTEELNKMIAMAQEKNVFLMEALWTYFLPHYQYVLDLMKNQELGKLVSLQADFGFKADPDPEGRLFNKKLGGGSLLDVGIYPVFAALTLIGYPDQINARAIFSESGVDEACDIVFTYKNDVIAQLNCSIIENTPTEAILTFENAVIKIQSRFHEPTQVTLQLNDEDITKNFDSGYNGYYYEAKHVNEMLLQNKKESPVMNFDKSINLMSLLDQIREQIDLTYKK